MRLSIIVALFLILLAGCSASTQTAVQGEVTLDGQPVGPGSIEFHPEPGTDSRRASAPLEGGKYALAPERGPSPGTFRVQIHWSKKTGRTIPSADPGFTAEETYEAMPAKYNNESSLIVELTTGVNTKDFHLNSK
jgi:hypothetical protein